MAFNLLNARNFHTESEHLCFEKKRKCSEQKKLFEVIAKYFTYKSTVIHRLFGILQWKLVFHHYFFEKEDIL